MADQDFEAQLREVLARINTLPESQRGPLMALVAETRRRHATIRDATARAREALDDWRLILKYLLFDEEARRREAQAKPDGADGLSEF